MKVIAVLVVVFALCIGVSASGYAVGAPFPFLAAGVGLVVSIGALGLIVAATVLMYRAPANRYLVTAVSYL
jgi:flagellar biosynthesis component FlhA